MVLTPSRGPLLSQFDRIFEARASEIALELPGAAGVVARQTFAELAQRAARMARALRDRGLAAGDRLVVQLPNGIEMIDLFLGTLTAGVILVPANVLYREREMHHIVGDAEPKAVVTTADRIALLPSHASAWDVHELARDALGAEPREPALPLDAATPAAILYTSGTTGRAKGAVLDHGNLAANTRTLLRAWRISAADRYLAVLPLFHVHGLVNGVCCWLASGCRMRLAERFDHASAAALFEAFQPTLFFGVPTVYLRLLEIEEPAARAIGASMRLFVSGSAPLPAHVFAAFRARFGHAILERYGMTETLMTIGNPYEGERRPGSVGLPFEGVEVRIVDPAGGDVPDGGVGQLLVRGSAVFHGYWRRPDETASAFDGGWFRTGDLASRAEDGYLTLRGRASELILCGGFNVYPREIEDVLLEQPGVREAAVVGVPDERRGERPLAFFVGQADPEALALECGRQLASFKVPKAFVRVAALPRNAMGKVEKAKLATLLPAAPKVG